MPAERLLTVVSGHILRGFRTLSGDTGESVLHRSGFAAPVIGNQKSDDCCDVKQAAFDSKRCQKEWREIRALLKPTHVGTNTLLTIP